MHVVRLSSKGQIVIPKDVRKRHGVRRNVDLVLLESGDAIVLRKKETVKELLRDEYTPLLQGAEGSLRELQDIPQDDASNDTSEADLPVP